MKITKLISLTTGVVLLAAVISSDSFAQDKKDNLVYPITAPVHPEPGSPGSAQKLATPTDKKIPGLIYPLHSSAKKNNSSILQKPLDNSVIYPLGQARK